MKTKEEVVKEAWGADYNLGVGIDENGWLSENYLTNDQCNLFNYDESFEYKNVFGYRPKSLHGIENYYSFKDITGFENYQVNKQGVVVSKSRVSLQKNGKKYTVKEKVMKPQIDNTGYIVFGLRNNKKETKKVYLHRILAESFIPNIENKPCINHKDGVKYNNSLDNLEWCTYQENNIHAFDNNFQKSGKQHHFYGKKGEFCHNSKKIICNDTGRIFDSLTEASLFFNISKSHLSNILKGVRKSSINATHYQPITKPQPPLY